jgi:hypothetical protein
MSEFVVCETEMTDPEVIRETLVEMGVKAEHIEMHETPVELQGYMGDERTQKAHIIIRRRHVGRSSNDLGFERMADGTYRAWVSDYDRNHGLGEKVMGGRMVQVYGKNVAIGIMRSRGWAIGETQEEKDGQIRVRVSK